MKVLIHICVLMLAGCAGTAALKTPSITAPAKDPMSSAWAGRVAVKASSDDQATAKLNALGAVEGEGWVFEPLFATASNNQGDDQAICGHANQSVSGNTLFFAFYQGELLLWDERAPAGLSIENQFITLICGITPPIEQAA